MIFDVIRVPFSFVISWIYSWSHSYLLAILLFAILIKIVLFPFGIMQQKNSQKQASLRPKESLIRKKYAGRNDKATQMKLNQEIQELYQNEHFSPLAGCLPMLVSMLVLLAVYGIVRAPMTYMAGMQPIEDYGDGTKTEAAVTIKQTVAEMVYYGELEDVGYPKDTVTKFVRYSQNKDDEKADKANFWEALNKGSYNYNAETLSCTVVKKNEDKFVQYLLNSGKPVIGETEQDKTNNILNAIHEIPDLELFGIDGFDLGDIPALGYITGGNLGQRLLLIIPIVTLVTSYFGQALTRKFTYQPEGTKEQQSQMKIMNIFMPLFSLFISFQVPAAVAIYWIIQNITSPVQQIILAKMFPIKELTPEELREAEKQFAGKPEKKKVAAPADGKKKKSLVYDDDDEYESVSSAEPKKKIQEKKVDAESIVEQAPLKDEEKE